MGVLADWQIKQANIIDPFAEGVSRPGVVSYGCSSYGYDTRLGYRFKVFTNSRCAIVDPKAFDDKAFEDRDLTPANHSMLGVENTWDCRGSKVRKWTQYRCTRCGVTCDDSAAPALDQEPCPARTPSNQLLVPPNSFVLGESLETFKIPRDVLAVCVGKSTYARCGVIVNVTPLEPEWEGKVTIEISNTTPLPAAIYAGEGIMQVLFLRSDGYRAYTTANFYQLTKVLRETASGNDENSVDSLVKHLRSIEEFYHRPKEELDSSCRVSYADKKGRYQSQTGLTTPFVHRGPEGA